MNKIKNLLNGPSVNTEKPLVSIVASAFNEEPILEDRLKTLAAYIETLKDRYDIEVILINDGSVDKTGAILEKFAAAHSNVTIFHHRQNQGLGRSLQDGFALTHGEYVVSIDIDLSCSLDHIERLLDKIIACDATIVIASPTMAGGEMVNIPAHRRILSRIANLFLSSMTSRKISNLTHMMRAYRGDFIRFVNLRASGMEVMPEIIYKAMIRDERIEQIPARLDWGAERKAERKSKMRVLHHTVATLMTSFILHPFFYFIFPGVLILLFSLYPLGWILVHFMDAYQVVPGGSFLDHASDALGVAYRDNGHTFFIGMISLLLSLQLIALGFLSLQNKHYYEEIFDMLSKLSKKMAESR